MPRKRGIRDALREPEAPARGDALEQRLRAGLLEGHPAVAQRAQAVGVLVDPDDAQTACGERQGQGQADAAQPEDGDVVRHLRPSRSS